jgi:transcriptional regulator with XRE-family HTH domain
MITPSQCRAARGLLGWSQKDLALRCTVSMRTIVTFEMRRTVPTPLNMKTIQEKLESGGVEFIDGETENKGPGVRITFSEEKRQVEEAEKHTAEKRAYDDNQD